MTVAGVIDVKVTPISAPWTTRRVRQLGRSGCLSPTVLAVPVMLVLVPLMLVLVLVLLARSAAVMPIGVMGMVLGAPVADGVDLRLNLVCEVRRRGRDAAEGDSTFHRLQPRRS